MPDLKSPLSGPRPTSALLPPKTVRLPPLKEYFTSPNAWIQPFVDALSLISSQFAFSFANPRSKTALTAFSCGGQGPDPLPTGAPGSVTGGGSGDSMHSSVPFLSRASSSACAQLAVG